MKLPPYYSFADTSQIFSPALLFYKDLIRANIARAVQMAGDAARLRPHVKTHKTREIVRMEMAAGIAKHKCATIAEAEMLATCGATDILLAYNIVGPNCERMVRLVRKYPESRFTVLADDARAAAELSEAMVAGKQGIDVLVDIDVGQHRTGVPPGKEAISLYETIQRCPGLRLGGLHVYDGHNHQESLAERVAAVDRLMEPVFELLGALKKKGLPVPRVVAGGTPTFPVYAKMDISGLECSPGTCILHDHGYGTRFADMTGFTPAALLLTRVVSRPTPTRITFDLGTKAVASDPPAGKRCILLDLEAYEPIIHNEEHFVVEMKTQYAAKPGDEFFAMPAHICPTCALHRQAYVVEDGQVTERWDIVSRDRVLTV